MRHSIKNALLILILLFIWNQHIIGQDFKFNKILPEDGGNFGGVTAITQDKNGFIWFATKRGFYKYDGSQLTSFINDPLNPNSPASNNIISFCVDDNGTVWAGTGNFGLDRYQPETGIFTHFQHDPNDPGSISNDSVNSILMDHEGKLWIATHQGLDQYDPVSNTFIHFKSLKNDSTTLSSNQVRVLYEDKKGTLWIGTGSVWPGNGGGPEDGGLNRYNRKKDTFTRYKHNPNDNRSLINNKIGSIYEDTNGVLWIGTGRNGLHKMNRQTGSFERIIFDPSNPEKFSGPEFTEDSPSQECINFMTQDVAGNYWFGTFGSGLFYFNPEVGKIVKYQGTGNSLNGFDNIGARSGFTSRDGILWIGGNPGGLLYRIDPLNKELPNHVISEAPVNCFFEDPDGIFWMGTENDLMRIDRNNGDTIRYNREINPLKAADNSVNVIKKDIQGTLWIGSDNGLHYRDEDNKKFVSYLHDPKNNYSISNNTVIDMMEDSQNNFWIATYNGLNLLDRKTGKFTTYYVNSADTTSVRSNIITSVFEDKFGKLWAGFWNGINLFDRETKTFKNYLKGLNVMDIYEDSDGILWMGTRQGLYKYNRNTDYFIRFDDTYSIRRLSDVSSIVEDNQKYLWIGTDDGIVRINPERDGTSLFGKNYGIAGNSLSWGSVYKSLDGAIYFGNTYGYYKINPVEILRNTNPPEVIITGFSLSNQNIDPDKNGPLKENLQEAKKIELNYNENNFSFEFAVIDYINPEENRLTYYLENYDQTWLRPNADKKAYYFNVPPGEYIFHVRGSNSNGVWAERKIDVIITPPWYQTSLAYGFYTLLLIASVFAFDRIMRRRIVEKERQKTQKRELAQAREIEKAYTKLKSTQTQLIQSEKMASLGELSAGIAHEIQNPLNFVNNFSEVNSELLDELVEERKKENRDLNIENEIIKDLKENEQKINHHGRRAESIVKGMLLHSRGSNGKKESTDINALCDEYLRLSYHGFRAKDKSFNADFKLELDESLTKINVIPQDIGRVLLNLINNAFYAVSEARSSKPEAGSTDYKPEVIVTTKKSGDKIEIRVIDNGNGIPQNIVDKIFQPFFTTKPTGSGTGLGLSLSYDIVTAHGGELSVKSKEGEGSEFTIVIPISE